MKKSISMLTMAILIIMIFLLFNTSNMLSDSYKSYLIKEMVDSKVDLFYVNSDIEGLETAKELDKRKMFVNDCIFRLEYMNSYKFKKSLSLVLNSEIEDDNIQSLNNAYKFFKENKDELINNGDVFQSKEFSNIKENLYNLEINFGEMSKYMERSNKHILTLSREYNTLNFKKVKQKILRDL